MKNGDKDMLSIILADQCILGSMLITLKCIIYFNQFLHTNTFLTLSRHRYVKR